MLFNRFFLWVFVPLYCSRQQIRTLPISCFPRLLYALFSVFFLHFFVSFSLTIMCHLSQLIITQHITAIIALATHLYHVAMFLARSPGPARQNVGDVKVGHQALSPSTLADTDLCVLAVILWSDHLRRSPLQGRQTTRRQASGTGRGCRPTQTGCRC
jgi:fumarate reductase subunit C